MQTTHTNGHQFALRTLLLFLFIVACIGSWYAYRVQRVRHERALLDGIWQIVSDNGTPVMLPNGQMATVEFKQDQYAANPFQEPRWLDFNVPGPSGQSKCIYRWEGARVRIVQASPGAERPHSFEEGTAIPEPVLKAGASVSITKYLLARAPPTPPAR